MCSGCREYDCQWIPCVTGIILGISGFAMMWIGVWLSHDSSELQNALTFGGIAICLLGVSFCVYSFFNETCFAVGCKKRESAVPNEKTSLINSQANGTKNLTI